MHMRLSHQKVEHTWGKSHEEYLLLHDILENIFFMSEVCHVFMEESSK